MNPSNGNRCSSRNSTGSTSGQRNTTTLTKNNDDGSDSSRASYHSDMRDDTVYMGGPGFCQIVHNHLVQNEQIRIPQRFIREYGDDLSNHAVLTVSGGKEWFVEMKRDSNSDDGGVYFKNGLKEFYKSYSITPGTFLVFKYEGNSHFDVVIFQMSGTEIDYSSFNNNNNNNNHMEETSSQTDDTINAEDDVDDKDDYYVEASADANDDNDESGDDSDDEECGQIRVGLTREKNRSITARGLETHDRAIGIKRGFKSSKQYPFFAIGLQPSYVDHKYLPIPSDFEGKEELGKLETIRLDVVEEYGRSWIVHVFTNGRDLQGIRFCKGVSRFPRDNNLKEGDVCVFEMVTKKKSSSIKYARVHIFRS
ncbi:B3 domain-containing transcription factor VRN1-like isoform X2 [Papaver somniferum]|uniref:B3 domain-containing transcription factor VRN1-like isoform X2 n=1 Tax=Papaver somniferum TaxID=3469 RepID=UPI000E6FCC19|nr:B3 domain-containing transcription factor VRN1-like isoform X2 [Papaver somniferum]